MGGTYPFFSDYPCSNEHFDFSSRNILTTWVSHKLMQMGGTLLATFTPAVGKNLRVLRNMLRRRLKQMVLASKSALWHLQQLHPPPKICWFFFSLNFDFSSSNILATWVSHEQVLGQKVSTCWRILRQLYEKICKCWRQGFQWWCHTTGANGAPLVWHLTVWCGFPELGTSTVWWREFTPLVVGKEKINLF